MPDSRRRAGVVADEFFRKALDSLTSQVAILDRDGTIFAVNAAWREFAARNNPGDDRGGPGSKYLGECDQAAGDRPEEAGLLAGGIRGVIAKRLDDFTLDCPCQSATDRRWFTVRVTRFEVDGTVHAVVTHDDITARKLAELRAQEANRLLEFQAATDGLTGIANRRSFDRTLEDEWKRHERAGATLSVALLDVDWFKRYNDHRGHLAGDDCLKAVAREVRSHLRRPGDFAARFGGEEFAVILPQTGAAGAAVVLGNILRGIRGLAIPHPATPQSAGVVTVSIGSATTAPRRDATSSGFLERADRALYEAKARGRDRLVGSVGAP